MTQFRYFNFQHLRPFSLVTLALLTISLLSVFSGTATAGIYSIRVLPSVTQANVGSTFTVVLTANMVVDSAATGRVNGVLTYPADLVQLQDVSAGQYPNVTITPSNSSIAVTSPDKGAGNGYGGQQVIFTATFKAVAGGTATFAGLNGVMVVNGTNHIVVAGSTTISGCQPGYSGTYPDCKAPSTTTTTSTTSKQSTSAALSTTTTPNNQPTTSSQNVTTDLQTTSSVTQTAYSAYGQTDPALEACISGILGEKAYQDLISQQSRLSYDQLIQTKQCFLERDSVVPSNYAPVEPARVKDLPTTDKLRLAKLEKVTNNGKPALRMSGTAKPNQIVVIYVFSEPLVLVTKADKDGNWTYELQDPMEPGKHQAYVTVENSDKSTVRSNRFGFAIIAAPKTNLNPTGLSLSLQKANTSVRFYIYYVVGAIAMISVGLFVSLHVMRQRSRQLLHDATLPTVNSDGDPPIGPIVGDGGI